MMDTQDALSPIQWCEAHKGHAHRVVTVRDGDPLDGVYRNVCPKCIGALRRLGLIIGHLVKEPRVVAYRFVDGQMPPRSVTREHIPGNGRWFELPGDTAPGYIMALNVRGYLVTR